MSRLLSRWALTGVGTAFAAFVLWFFGPLWPPLEPVLPRVVAVQTLFVVWAAANALLDWRRRLRSAALAAGLSAAPEGEERAAVAQAMARALATLRRRDRALLTELPWYAVIGPPGAGKTTALLNAGLRFPLADAAGAAALPGVGGTRLCEWWFTDDAVLIDTAGRYTTQDSDEAVDRAGWNAFLSLVKRTRPSQPLNGVIVAIALPDVAGGVPAERDAHAAAIARRISELEQRFALRLPVYVLFTKADLLAGFSEFFDDLDASGRDQVLGETFAPGAAGKVADRFAAGFRELAGRVASRMLPRLGAEHRPERRLAIAGFPTQFASLEKPLSAFVATAFAGAGLLRGVYFASGTQEGTPMDRLTGAMSRVFGVAGGRLAPLQPQAGRSYFLGRLLREVILGEALLVRRPPAAARRRTLLRAAQFAAIALLLAGATGTVLWNARSGTDQVSAMSGAVDAVAAAAAPLATDPVTDGDLRPLLPVLDQARSLAASVPPDVAGLGLGQSAKLDAGAAAAYRNLLAFGLLPRLAWRLEAELRGAAGDPARAYELLRVYLMLGSAGPLDPAPVRAWLATDWARTDPGAPELLPGLLEHLDRLLAEPLPPVGLDGTLVAATRAAVQQVPPAVRVYATLRSSAAATALPPWRPADVLGPAGVTVFTRASGRSMADGIPGLWTANGFRSVVQQALPAAVRQVATEGWVVGRTTEFTPAEQQQLRQDVLARYLDDFTARWDALLGDLYMAPVATLPQAAQAFYILASPQSPLRDLLKSVGSQVQLPPENGAAVARYAGLLALTGGDGAALERSLRLVADVQQQLAKIAALPVGTAVPPGGEDIGNALAVDAARQPAPLSRWLSTVAAEATALRTGNARKQVALAFNAPNGPAQACAAVVTHYPFAPGGTPLSPDEFARVFGPAGLLQSFFTLQLKPYVDVSTRPWKLEPAAPLGTADAAQFARAASLRDLFFPAGQATPSFAVTVAPGPASRPATLQLGDVAVVAGTGAPRTTEVAWPPPGGTPPDARLTVPDAPAVSAGESGFWALHRLFNRGRMQAQPRTGRQNLTFGTPPAAVVFEVGGSGSTAPGVFAPGLFTDFRCPSVQ